MMSPELPNLSSEVDRSKVPPIQQKRILAFVNHFVVSTVSFLNTFATQCETKFIECEQKMRRVEASLLIVEEKLSSITCLENKTESVKNSKINESAETTIQETKSISVVEKLPNTDHINIDVGPIEVETVEETNTTAGIKVQDDARYKKFFKMVQFGVLPQAVKQKMEAEGLDPHLLDNPNQIITVE